MIVELLVWFFFLFFLSLLCCCGYIQLIGPQPVIGMILGITKAYTSCTMRSFTIILSTYPITCSPKIIISIPYHHPNISQPSVWSTPSHPPVPNGFFCLARLYQQQPRRSIQLIQIIPTAITSDHHFAIVSPRCPTGDAIAAAFLRNHKEIKVA